jgi:hypothetical protein
MKNTSPHESRFQSEKYTQQELTKLIVNSFRISKGVSRSLDSVLAYLAQTYGERMTVEAIEDSFENGLKPAMNYANSSAHPSFISPLNELDTRLVMDDARDHMKKILIEGPSEADVPIVDALVDVDYYWHPTLGQNRKEPKRPYVSNVIHFGMLKKQDGSRLHSTSFAEYDAMFDEVAAKISTGQITPEVDDKFRKIWDAHFEINPLDQDYLPSQARDAA